MMGHTCSEVIHDPLQNSKLSMCTKEGYDSIELVTHVNEKSPTYRIIETNGDIPYHLCYRVKNIDTFIESLKKESIEHEVVTEAKPAVLFGNDKVIFISIKGFGTVELLEVGEDLKKLKLEDTKIHNTTRFIINEPENAVKFLEYMGYVQKRNTIDHEKQMAIINLEKNNTGNIELLIPTEEIADSKLKSKDVGINIYQICYETDSIDKLETISEQEGYICNETEDTIKLGVLNNIDNSSYFSETDYAIYYEKTKNITSNNINKNVWEVELVNKENLIHKNYLLPLQNSRGQDLLKLPVYEMLKLNIRRTEYLAPSDEIEEKLVHIWENILGVNNIGINDNFFDLGGNSLLVIKVGVMMEKQGFNIDYNDIYKYLTIKGIAEYLKGDITADQETLNVASKAKESRLRYTNQAVVKLPEEVLKKNTALTINYYYDENGNKDEIAKFVGTCFTRNIFFFLKNKVDNPENLYKVYIGDISINLFYTNDGEIGTVMNIPALAYEKYVNKNTDIIFKGQLQETIMKIEELLDNGETVFVSTIMRKIPYYKSYNEGENNVNDNTEHVATHWFLIVGHDEESYYYVDNMININPNYFYKSLESNKNIGVSKKTEFYNAFDYFTRLVTFIPKYEKIEQTDTRLFSVFDKMIEDYYEEEPENTENYIRYGGRYTLMKFINACDTKSMELNHKLSNYNVQTGKIIKNSGDHVLFDRIRLSIEHTYNKRQLLIKLFSSIETAEDERIREIVEALKISTEMWNDLKEVMTVEFYKENYVFGEVLKEAFSKVLNHDDKLFGLLRDRIEFLYKIF